MQFIEHSPSYGYDDVLLVPQTGLVDFPVIKSRSEINTSTNFCGVTFDIPLMNAPMDSIASGWLLTNISKAGGLPVECRFGNNDFQSSALFSYLKNSLNKDCPIVISVGTNKTAAAEKIKLVTSEFDISLNKLFILIDVANGYSPVTEEIVYFLSDLTKKQSHIIVGNVVTPDGLNILYEAGAEAIRVGIGNGANCSTRLMTGIGMGQVTALMECVKYKDTYYPNKFIIADGGIKTPGDFSKALAIGADMVMVGRAFAGCVDCPDWVWRTKNDEDNGEKMAIYRGMASAEAMRDNSIETTLDSADYGKLPEGEEVLVPFNPHDAYDITKTYQKGLQSSMSYVNAPNLGHYKGMSVLRVVSNAVQTESKVRK